MKKLKNLLAIILILAMLIPICSCISSVDASSTISDTDPLKLGIQAERPYETLGDEYAVLVNNLQNTVFKIGEKREAINNLVFDKNIYCVRAGIGFANSENANNPQEVNPIDYKFFADYKKNASTIINYYDGASPLYNNTNLPTDKYASHYNEILWIIDNMYLPNSEDAEAMKTKLIANLEAYYDGNQLYDGLTYDNVTDNDIELIQQMAIWYFTNYDENGNSVSLTTTQTLSSLLSINNINDFDNDRKTEIDAIYRYFINSATENALKYGIGESVRDFTSEEPELVSFSSSTNPQVTSDTTSYYVGPFTLNVTEGYLNSVKDITSNVRVFSEMFDLEQEITNYSIVTLSEGVYSEVVDLKEGVLNNSTNFYVRIPGNLVDVGRLNLQTLKLSMNYSYLNPEKNIAELWVNYHDDDSNEQTPMVPDKSQQPVLIVERDTVQKTTFYQLEEEKEFDLSLRKFIVSINGNVLEGQSSRVPQINTSALKSTNPLLKSTTATYTHNKTPLPVQTGDKVTYTLRIYNEGDLDGYAKEITDYLPVGLKFVPVSQSTINTEYQWVASADGRTITTDYLNDTLIKAYNSDTIEEDLETNELWQKSTNGTDGLYYADIKVECEVIAELSTQNNTLRNIAEISEDADSQGNEVDDRDSLPDNVNINNYTPPADNSTYQQDDDDYEDLVLPAASFDLALRKYITNVNGEDLEEEASRVPQINLVNLNKTGVLTGKKITTATYTHPKDPVIVKKGDIVTYKIRIYNEGELDGYAKEITDYIPEGLGLLLNHKTNMIWHAPEGTETIKLVGDFYETEEDVKNLVVEDFYEGTTSLDEVYIATGKTAITTSTLNDQLIKAYNPDITEQNLEENELWQESTTGDKGLYYQEVEVACIVLKENTYKGTLRNIAEISEDADSQDNEIDDRDSLPDNVNINNYTPPADNSTYQQDDDDYEDLVLKYFDLALRKFITKVNEKELAGDDLREPEFYIDEDGNYRYRHTKEPVLVANSDIVTYTLRIYNEGTLSGYAEEIEDDIPAGLGFLPTNETNQEYGWKMYYKDEEGNLVETTDVTEATVIRTDYLSKAKAETYELGEEENENGQQQSAILDSNLLQDFDPEIMDEPDYRDIQVAFKVIEEDIPEESIDRIIINKAQITDDADEKGKEVDDEDSTPDEWIEGEDDQDREYIYVKEFDLSLLKWVTKSIVTVDDKTTVTETGFEPNQGKTETTGIRENSLPEPIAKVEIDRKKLSSTVVKFVYSVKVTNEGEIEGYATELTDYIPEGLAFVQEDNPLWIKDGDNKVTTRALETTLLKPGESATVEVIFTWINDSNNLGVKRNIAEISEDYNEYGSNDIDSTPDNIDVQNYDKEQEDDDDFALVILSITTGNGLSYINLILAVISILLVGILLIKKYVL